MWRDILITNRDAIVAALKLFGSTVDEFQELIETGDMAALENIFNRGRAMRERFK
jgi:prephenate dehydrogenase